MNIRLNILWSRSKFYDLTIIHPTNDGSVVIIYDVMAAYSARDAVRKAEKLYPNCKIAVQDFTNDPNRIGQVALNKPKSCHYG
jgi:hypothetical protein